MNCHTEVYSAKREKHKDFKCLVRWNEVAQGKNSGGGNEDFNSFVLKLMNFVVWFRGCDTVTKELHTDSMSQVADSIDQLLESQFLRFEIEKHESFDDPTWSSTLNLCSSISNWPQPCIQDFSIDEGEFDFWRSPILLNIPLQHLIRSLGLFYGRNFLAFFNQNWRTWQRSDVCFRIDLFSKFCQD